MGEGGTLAMSILTAGREAPTAYNALGEYVELTAGREAPTAQNALGVYQTAGRKAPTAANAFRRIHGVGRGLRSSNGP